MTEAKNTYQTARPLTVALLYGGISNEREISLLSARNVQAELLSIGHEIVMIDTGISGYIDELRQDGIDVAFIALHGQGGEDGTIQGLLELLGIPYVGSGVMASALAMDKMRTKLLLEAAGVMTPIAAVLSATDTRAFAETSDGEPVIPAPDELCGKDFSAEFIAELVGGIGLPCVVKPLSFGSSVGVSIAHDEEGLRNGLVVGFSVSPELLVEAFVPGTEVTVAVIGNDEPMVLPVIEIVSINEFYDYESKYAQGGSTHIIPARLPHDQLNACEDAAYASFEIIGCRGVARVDMIVSDEGVPWVFEVNTIPGMTSTSLLPDAARAAGIEVGELYDRLLLWALEDVPLGARGAVEAPAVPAARG